MLFLHDFRHMKKSQHTNWLFYLFCPFGCHLHIFQAEHCHHDFLHLWSVFFQIPDRVSSLQFMPDNPLLPQSLPPLHILRRMSSVIFLKAPVFFYRSLLIRFHLPVSSAVPYRDPTVYTCTFHLPCLLNAFQFVIQQQMNVSAYRSLRIRRFMKMEQIAVFYRFNCLIHVIESDLSKWSVYCDPAGSSCYSDQSGIFQLSKDFTNNNRIRIDASSKEVTGHLVFCLKMFNTCKYMQGNRKSA